MPLTIDMSCIPTSNIQIQAMASFIIFQTLDANIVAFMHSKPAWSQQLQVNNGI